ncbi:hypothetical protein [Gilliamella sp. Imp1-1]|uniref:hypothetical protein n=1 Tax=Gilliamella sp. Imp1-1 TaxID=3120248 RepID=UPI000461B308|nr:hypothetical protein [Gilliamella apicola]KDN10687.1 hypothetical protein GAPWKB30_0656 [Gilliamella apicola]OCG53298.1 hypothetical protein A9G38_03915 [Gilliamella apicola]
MKILFCNIGWMKHYRGQTSDDQIINGGSYNETGVGLEVTNFYRIDNYCYGYVYVKSQSLDLSRIAKEEVVNKDFIDDVCIVWVAKSPKGKRFIVGWYKNAKVYGKPQHLLNNDDKNPDIIDYWLEWQHIFKQKN